MSIHTLKPWLTLTFLVPMLLAGCRQAESGGRRRTDDEARAQSEAIQKALKPSCDDVECDEPARCEESDGVAACVCPRGYVSDEEGVGCEDVDECEDSAKNECAQNAQCTNTVGDYTCECDAGFLGDGRSCEAGAACDDDTNSCHPDALCMPADSGVSCTCKDGFEGDDKACGDIDECASGVAMCGEGATCQNRRGTYNCACELPFVGDNGRSGCQDACEVALEDCAQGARCSFSVEGEASCTSCESGFLGNGRECTANSECAALGCGDNTVCAGDSGSRRCECAEGFSGNAASGCEDIDECDEDDRCGDSGRCINVPGGYICGCAEGFERVDGECRSVNECERETDLCDPHADCTDTDAGYDCACKEGFEGDGRTCVDIDECANDDTLCDDQEGTVCRNRPGKYECACPPGFAGNGKDEACACDITGIWGARIDTQLEVNQLAAGDVVLIDAMKMRTWVWELNRFVWDGKQIKIENKNCGMSDDPEIFSPHYEETYSVAVPQKVYDTIADYKHPHTVPLSREQALPGKSYVTPPEAWQQGLDLDDPFMEDWFGSTADVPKNAWVDYDGDGEPGVTFWPASTDIKVRGNSDNTYEYLPVELKAGSTLVATRVGCISVGLRMIREFNGKFESCSKVRGDVDISRFDARVEGCTTVRMSEWESGEVTCDRRGWEDAPRCNAEGLQFIDEQDLPRETGGEFELVKLGGLDDEIDCAAVRKALPPLPR